MSERNAAEGARRTALTALTVVVVMGALSFAAVPFYDLFCRVTGFAGTTQRGDAASAPTQERAETVMVIFDASVARDMPWDFKPTQTSMRVHLGEMALATYTAHNPTDRPITGSATFNVAPLDLGGYFTKIDCFCFTEQTLQPGETVEMPVTFYVDPELADDPENGSVGSITLSYTFFEQDSRAEDDATATQ